MSVMIEKPLEYTNLDSKNNPSTQDNDDDEVEEQVLEKNFIVNLKEKELGALTVPRLFVLPNFEKLKEIIRDAIDKK